jgi:hypothetical protein
MADILWDSEANQKVPSSTGLRMLWTNTGNGSFAVTGNVAGQDRLLSGYAPVVADLNRDGKSDVYWYAINSSTGTAATGPTAKWLSTSSAPLSVVSAATPTPKFGGTLALFGDLNGDYRPDIGWLVNPDIGEPVLWIQTSNPDGSMTTSTVRGPLAGVIPGVFNFNVLFTPTGPDLNGDGITDILWQSTTGGGTQAIWFGNGDGTFRTVAGADASVANYTPHYADLNGDNNLDILWDSEDGNGLSTGHRIVWMSRGDGTFAVQGNVNGLDNTLSGYKPYIGDFNGDGRADVLWDSEDSNGNSTGTRVLWLSNGDGTFTVVANFNGQDGTLASFVPILADFNGDGKTDILWDLHPGGDTRSGGQRVLWLSDGLAPDLVTTVTTGLGATTALTYQPLTSSAVYTRDSNAVDPTVDMQLPMFVLSRLDGSNGVGGTNSFTYSYAGAKSDLYGRAFLGFRQITATDLQTNIVQTTNYRQDYPFIGLVTSATKTLGATTLSQTTNTYGATSLGGTRFQVFATQSAAQSADLDGSAIPGVTTSYQYDAFGNTTQVVASTSDGYSKTTTNTYTNDATNWFLGRLTNATVTAVGPAPPTPPSPASPPDMTVALTHFGRLLGPGETGAIYSITVSNVGTGSSFGTVSLTDQLPTGLTATAIAGAGWSCTLATLICTRGDSLAPGSSYPAVTLTVSVAANAPGSVTNVAIVSGGGEMNASNDTASDPTSISFVNATIAANTSNLNLWNYLVANGLASAGVAGSWAVTIAGGVAIGSTTTGVPAFDTGAFPPGSVVQLTNNGIIVGAGGTGGNGGACHTNPHLASPGAAGGPAFRAQTALRFTNNGGIWGGGGGGGGGSGSGYFKIHDGATVGVGGGGGGGGAGTGAGGTGGQDYTVQQPGSPGTVSGGGAGGSTGLSGTNGRGGAGGGPAQAGAAGTAGIGITNFCGGGAAPGGAPGVAIIGNSLVTWSPMGDVRGALN